MKKKKMLFIALFILLIKIEPVSAMKVVNCGGLNEVPYVPLRFVGRVINIIKVVTPIVLIIMGMVDMARATTANSEKDMDASRKRFMKRIVYAVMVFFVISVVQLLFSILQTSVFKNENNLLGCMTCVLGGECDTKDLNITSSNSDGSNKSNSSGNSNNTSGSSNKSSKSNNKKKDVVVIVGASKICQLEGTYGNNYVNKFNINYGKYVKNSTLFFVCKGGQGYNWLQNTAMSSINNIINNSSYNKVSVIFEIGGNDLRVLDTNEKTQEIGKKYATLYNQKASEWDSSRVKIYAFSLDPFVEKNAKNNKVKDKGYTKGYKTNDKVKAFNKGLKSNLSTGVEYKNIFDYYYTGNGKKNYKTADGVHYTKKTAQNVYNKIIDSI